MITASIVLYNTPERFVREVVGCVEKSAITKAYIVDNSSMAQWKGLLETISNKTDYICGHGNIGFGCAHNIALRKAIDAGTDYHVIINPDISFESEVIEQLFHFMEGYKDVGCVMPDVVYPDGREQYLCKLLPTPLDILGRRVFPAALIKRRNDKYEMRSTGYQDVRNVPQLSGCFMFLRTNILKKVGFFDERFFMYFEDIDFCRRIHQKSMTVFYPKVKIVHHHHSEHRSNRTLLRASIKSAFQYFNKWGWMFDRERRMINKKAFSPKNIIE